MSGNTNKMFNTSNSTRPQALQSSTSRLTNGSTRPAGTTSQPRRSTSGGPPSLPPTGTGTLLIQSDSLEVIRLLVEISKTQLQVEQISRQLNAASPPDPTSAGDDRLRLYEAWTVDLKSKLKVLRSSELDQANWFAWLFGRLLEKKLDRHAAAVLKRQLDSTVQQLVKDHLARNPSVNPPSTTSAASTSTAPPPPPVNAQSQTLTPEGTPAPVDPIAALTAEFNALKMQVGRQDKMISELKHDNTSLNQSVRQQAAQIAALQQAQGRSTDPRSRMPSFPPSAAPPVPSGSSVSSNSSFASNAPPVPAYSPIQSPSLGTIPMPPPGPITDSSSSSSGSGNSNPSSSSNPNLSTSQNEAIQVQVDYFLSKWKFIFKNHQSDIKTIAAHIGVKTNLGGAVDQSCQYFTRTWNLTKNLDERSLKQEEKLGELEKEMKEELMRLSGLTETMREATQTLVDSKNNEIDEAKAKAEGNGDGEAMEVDGEKELLTQVKLGQVLDALNDMKDRLDALEPFVPALHGLREKVDSLPSPDSQLHHIRLDKRLKETASMVHKLIEQVEMDLMDHLPPNWDVDNRVEEGRTSIEKISMAIRYLILRFFENEGRWREMAEPLKLALHTALSCDGPEELALLLRAPPIQEVKPPTPPADGVSPS